MQADALLELDRLALARLGREYMVAAQLNSRTGYAALRINHGDAAYKDTAIDNWMAVSPVYTRRMQRAMGFAGGSDVATIFKGLQLECGFAHQYMDVHFEADAADSIGVTDLSLSYNETVLGEGPRVLDRASENSNSLLTCCIMRRAQQS